MPDLIRHPVPAWIPAFAGMTTLMYLVAGVIVSQADKLFFECNGATGICRIEKNGKLIQEYPIERCVPLLNHIKVIFGLDRAEKRVPRRWETYKIESENGAYICKAIPQISTTSSGEVIIINFRYDHSPFRNDPSRRTMKTFPDFLNKGELLWF